MSHGGRGISPGPFFFRRKGDKVAEKKRYSKRVATMVVDIEEKDGSVREYTIRGLDGPSHMQFEEFMEGFMEEKDGKKTMKQGAAVLIAARLMSLTVFDLEGKAMEEGEALTMPTETLLGIMEDAAKLSGLDRLAKEAAKNA